MKRGKLFLLAPVVFLLVLFAWEGGARAGVAQVAAGRNPSRDVHNVIVKCDGTLWAWGKNDSGQLGDGTTEDKNSPVQIGTDSDWQAVSAGYTHTVALKTDGSLWAWGENSDGQLGDGTTDNKSNPVHIGTDDNWQSVAAGGSHTIALKNNGTLWAWGYNDRGQVGDGTTTNKTSPVQIGAASDWKTVAVGDRHTFALKKDGTLWAWGANYYGQLGDGTRYYKTSPVQIGTDTDWKAVSGGSERTEAVKSDGSLWAWGRDVYIGNGDDFTTSPFHIGTDTDWQVVAVAGYDHTLALKTDGSLWTWGNSYDGTHTHKTSPVQVGMDTDWQAVAVGSGHCLAIKNNGSLWAWGANWSGQLGNGTGGSRNRSPVQVGNETDWKAVAAGDGYNYTIALKNNGSLWAWGSNYYYGNLGNGTTIDRQNPIQIGTDSDWQAVSAGYNNTVALKENSTLWAWGHELGNGTSQPNGTIPEQVGSDANWQAVAAGDDCTLGLKADGSLWWCGYNNSQNQIGIDSDWQAISAGSAGYNYEAVALKQDGSLWAIYPYYLYDQVTPIGSDTDWIAVSAGDDHAVALKEDGSLWAWGKNSNGQLGDGTTEDKNNPVRIGTDDDNWQAVAAGSYYTVAVKQDGTLWAWGWNEYGQLGDGTATGKYEPVQIGDDTDWLAVSAGYSHTIALKNDGTLWAWGCNDSGELGTGTAWKESPVLIIPSDGSICSSSYTVTPLAGAGGSISPNTPQSVDYGQTTDFEVTPATGYSIDKVEGCGGTLSGSTYTTGAITADCTVTASFVINKYTVTPSAGGHGSISPAAEQIVEYNGTTSLTVMPDTGYAIDKVEGCGGTLVGNLYTTGAITADCTVTATFVSSTTYTVTPRTGRHGSISPPAPQQVRQGMVARFTVTPDVEYAIRYVSGCGGSLSGNVYTTGPITQDCSVTALFKRLPKHLVIPSAGRHGSISPRRPQRVLHGMTTSFTVTPRPGYAVRNVSGCGGSLSGDTYTTGAITRSCWVRASFMKEEDAPLMSR